jgi:hypothetical protein
MGLTMMKRLMGSLLLLCCVGCASQSSILVSGANPGQRVVKTQRMILWGLIESDKTWDPRTQCQNGISKVDVTEFFTLFGIYGTYELTAWCAAGSQAQGSNTGSVIIVR